MNIIYKIDRFANEHYRPILMVGMIVLVVMVMMSVSSCQSTYTMRNFDLENKLHNEMKWSGISTELVEKNVYKYTAIVPCEDDEYYCTGLIKYENGKVIVLSRKKLE